MSFSERKQKYDTVDVPTAYRAHVAKGIRNRFANEFDFSGLSDDDVIARHHARFGVDMDPPAYAQKVDEVYGHGFTPPPAPTETFGERVSGMIDTGKHVAKEMATSIAPFLVPEVPKAAAALSGGKAIGTALGGVAKKIPVVSQIGFLAGHTVNAAVDTHTAGQLEQTAQSIPAPNAAILTEEYFQKLRPGLTAKGFTDEEIRKEAAKRAQNVVTGYNKTIDSIGEEVDRTQSQAAITEPARAAADAFFLGVGAPAIEATLSKGLARVGITLGTTATKPAAGAVAQIASHAKTGAVVGAPGMALQGAIEHSIQAAAENKSPQDIGRALATGAFEGAKMGAIGGAVIGGGVGVLGEGLGAATRPFAAAAEKQRATQMAAAVVAMQKTADSFDPRTSKFPIQGDPADIATTIIQQTHGDDAVLSEAGLRAATAIERKLRLHQEAEAALNPTKSLPPNQNAVGTRPVGDMNTGGGIAPEPNAPTAVQGPAGEQIPPFTPPGQAVAAPDGFERLPQPAKSTPELEITGVAPEEPVSSAVRLSQPLPLEGPRYGSPALEPQERLGNVAPEKTVTPETAGHAPADDAALKKLATEIAKEKTGERRLSVSSIEEIAAKVAAERQKAGLAAPQENPATPVPEASSPTVPPEPKPSAPAPQSEVPKVETAQPEKTGVPEVTPLPPVSKAQQAIIKLGKLDHADVEETPEGTLRIIRLGRVSKPGGTPQDLDAIVQAADEAGVRIETDVTPPPGIRGGRIPLEKVIPWYQARGFRVIETTRIPEGALKSAKLAREPKTSKKTS